MSPESIAKVREALSNLIALADPHFTDKSQALALSEARQSLALLDVADGWRPKVTDWNLAAAIIAYRDASGKIPIVVGMRAALEKFLVTPEQMSLPPPRQEPPK